MVLPSIHLIQEHGCRADWDSSERGFIKRAFRSLFKPGFSRPNKRTHIEKSMVQARSIVAKNYSSNQNFLVGEEASCAGNCE